MADPPASSPPPGGYDLDPLNQPSVDFLILADRAEAISGKLYLMGGAWDRIYVADTSSAVLISFAIGILVPWNATNQQHRVTIAIEDLDGNPLEFRAELGFTQGRPPVATHGETQRVILAHPSVPVQFPRHGSYLVRATINGISARTATFHVALPLGTPPPTR